MIYICGEIITIHANVILMKVMMKKEYNVPMMECTKSSLRVSLLTGSNGEVTMPTGIIESGNGNEAGHRQDHKTDYVSGGSKDDNPMFNM